MPVTGLPKFDAIAVAEVTIAYNRDALLMKAKAAYVNTKTGTTHGWLTGTVWSKETLAKLEELRESLERDLAARNFTSASTETAEYYNGLGEHLGGYEAPQT